MTNVGGGGRNMAGYLHEPAVRQGSIVQTGETKDKLPGPWEAVGVLGRVSSSHLDAPFARLNFDSRCVQFLGQALWML